MFIPLRIRESLLAVWILFALCGSAFGNDLFLEMGIIKPSVRVKAPAFTLKSIDGTTWSLEDFKDKVILLNFWATWCGPCRDEMPAMERLWNKFKGRGFVIIAIAADRSSADKVKEFCKTHGVTLPVLLDPEGKVRRTYEVIALPTSYIIGMDGKIIGKILGDREWDTPLSKNFFEILLDESKGF